MSPEGTRTLALSAQRVMGDIAASAHDRRLATVPRVNVLSAARRRRAAAAVLVGAVVAGVVGAALLLRAPGWTAETSLIARPSTDILAPASTQFGEVVALGLPALPELATTPSVLEGVRARVPDAPPLEDLARHVEVALVPGAGVARVTVRAADEDLAARLDSALVEELVAADVLAPAARFAPLDDTPRTTRVGTSLTTAAAGALAAGLLAGAATAAAVGWSRRRGTDAAAVREALERAGHAPVAVLDGRDPAVTDRIVALQRAGGRPLRVVVVGPDGDGASRLRTALGERSVPVVDDGAAPGAAVNGTAGPEAAVVAVLDGRTTAPDELSAATAALRGASVLAVVLS